MTRGTLACPGCRTPLDSGARSFSIICPGCHAAYRSPAMAVLLSMALPGLGHWFLGRRAMGAVEFLIGLALLCGALYRLWVTFAAVIDERAPAMDLLRVCVPWALALGAYSLLDGLFTWLVSRRRLVSRGPEDV